MGKLAKSGKYDHIVIESAGISEPMPVVATFEWQWEDGTRLADVAPIDTMVTLVDAPQFLQLIGQKQLLREADKEATPEDERTIADLLVDQIEFADKIYITKPDLTTPGSYKATEALIKKMNPRAGVEKMTEGKVNGRSVSENILGAHLYDEDTARAYEGYLNELANPHTPETEEYGISSVVFRGDRPFDHGRLLEALRGTAGLIQVWHQAGPDLRIQPAGSWGSAGLTPANEVVLIGVNFDAAAAIARFQDAMLNDYEVTAML